MTNAKNTHLRKNFNAFAMGVKDTQTVQQNIDKCISTYYVTMASIYNTAQSTMTDAKAELRKHPKVYRQYVKQYVNKAFAAYDEWEMKMRLQLKDRYQLWLDLSDAVDEEIGEHIFKLYMAFDGVLLKHNIKDHVLMARMETALTMINFARLTFDNLFDIFKEYVHVDLRPLFRGGDFKDVQYYWKQACSCILKTPSGEPEINFNDSPEVNLAYSIIMQKLSSHNIYNTSADSALRQNKDIWKYLDKEDRMRLKKGMPLT